MRREAPEPWASAMVDRDFIYGGSPSIRALARAARTALGSESPSDAAVHKVVMGEVEQPEDDTVNGLALALGLDVRVVAGWVGAAREQRDPWRPPDGADRLTRKQRDVLDALVRVMIDDRQERDDRGNAAPTTQAPLTAAPDPVPEDEDEDMPPPALDQAAAYRGKPQPAFDSQVDEHDNDEGR